MFAAKAATLQATIGNQAMLRDRTQRRSNLAEKTSAAQQGHEADPQNVTAREGLQGPAWDFSKIPIFPPERADRSQPSSLLAATQTTRPGPELTAHELAHAAQDRPGDPSAQTLEPPSARIEADRVAERVLRMPGAPLEPGVRRAAEQRFGRDFGNVRVHCGAKAAQAVAAIGAPAFTLGRHIVGQDGAFDPATPEGHAILSHEMTHLVQQAAFGDHNLAGAPVLDAAHSSEQEARAGTDAPSPLAAPAIQRAPPDIATSGQQLTVDLTNPKWRQTLDFGGGQTQIVYVLRDNTTGELLKVGKTTVSQIASRFGEYVAAGNKWSRKLVADVWTLRARGKKNVEVFEAEMRSGLEKAGARLPWDNTRVPKIGPRLGRPGQGIPDTKPQTETEFIDEVEQLRVRHAPPNIAERRGTSSKEKAKLVAAEQKAGADASAKAAQDTQQAGNKAGGDDAPPPPAGPAKVEPIPGKSATPELKVVSDGSTATQPKLEMPPVGEAGAGAGAASARLGLEASRLRMAGRFLAEEAPGLLLQTVLMLLFPPEVHIHDESYAALSSQKIEPALQRALKEQAATLNKLAADDAAQSIWATVTVESDFLVNPTEQSNLEIYLQDVRFVGMKLTREYLLVERKEFDLGQGRNVSRTVTYSVPIFGPATHGSEEPIRNFRKVRQSLTDSAYKVRLSAMISMYKLANADPFLTNQLIRDLQGMSKDDDSTVRDVAAHLLNRLKPVP